VKPDTRQPTPVHLAALAGLSAAVLAFEVLLLRLFEFSHWHHFAGLAISLALLGLGSAGTVLALLGARAVRLGDRWFLGGLLTAVAGLLLVLWLQAHVALRPMFAVWDAGELARVLAVDLAAFLPFFGAGLAIGQVFPRWPDYPGRLYSANLLGSAAGSLGASLLLLAMPVEVALALVAAGLAALGLALALVQRLAALAVASLVVLVPAGGVAWQTPEPAVSDFKALARVMDLPDARVLDVHSGLPGRLTLVRSDSLRFAPGLSLEWGRAVPAMDGVVIGSDRMLSMPRRFGEPPDHAAASLMGLAPGLRDGRVAALGSSTWFTPAAVDPGRVIWVEPDHRLLELAAARGAAPGMTLVADSPYRFLATSRQRFAVIAVDGAYGGGDAATEDYLMTGAGLARAFERLEPDGLLALPLAVDYPPRQGPRALATVAEALERAGAEQPGEHVAALRGMQSMLVLASRRPLDDADITDIRAFAERWNFDLVWLPGLGAEEANRHHVLNAPVFFESARAVFGRSELPAEARWFETAPASPARPYFWRSMVWARVPAMLDRMGTRALSHLDWTLVLSALTALVVTVLAFLLILAPLGRLPAIRPPLSRLSVAGYFTALGLGYMLLEMAVFQRAILYLGEPVLTASVVFALFMAGSGIGSAMAPTAGSADRVGRVFGAVAAGLALAGLVLWLTGDWLQAPALAGRIALLVLLLLPLTWAMGRPFPWALHRLAGQSRWVPWAWGINGFASVAGASLAPLVSVQWSQPATLGAGAVCYAGAFAIALSWARR
jgi:hypothetical protein